MRTVSAEPDIEIISIGTDLSDRFGRAYALGPAFFSRSEQHKRRFSAPLGDGYRPFGLEHSGTPESPDRIESFTVSGRTEWGGGLGDRAIELREAMLNLFDRLLGVAEETMLKWAEHTTGRPLADTLAGGLRRWSSLQMNFALPTGRDDFINTVHDDVTVLSLCHAEQAGLEIEQADGSFAAAPCGRDALVVLPGRIATLLSGGLIPTARHRVRGGAAGRRISLIFFADLEPSRCRPWVRTPFNANVDIGAVVRASPTLFGLPPFPFEES